MSDNSDRIEHCRVAGELSSSLILTGGLRTKVAEPIANLALQGWGIRLGFLTEWGIRVGLLFDRYGGHKERWFWFGIFSDAPIPAALLGKLPERWAVRITYRQKDKADDGFVHLKRPLMTSLVGRTIHEAYGPEDHWLGLYSPPGRAAFCMNALTSPQIFPVYWRVFLPIPLGKAHHAFKSISATSGTPRSRPSAGREQSVSPAETTSSVYMARHCRRAFFKPITSISCLEAGNE